MPHSMQEIAAKISALPEPLQEEVFDFIEFMHIKAAHQALLPEHGPALLNEQTSAAGWNQPDEDEVWINY